MFSRDVTAAILVSSIDSPGIELEFLCERFLLLWLKNKLIYHVIENTLQIFTQQSRFTLSSINDLMFPLGNLSKDDVDGNENVI